MAILAPAPLASPQLSDCIGRSGRVLQTRGQTPSATPAPYSTRIQQRHRPRAAPRDFHRLLTCPSDRERPRCREFASRGSGVQIPSAPPNLPRSECLCTVGIPAASLPVPDFGSEMGADLAATVSTLPVENFHNGFSRARLRRAGPSGPGPATRRECGSCQQET
jgi:hypothetical protein